MIFGTNESWEIKNPVLAAIGSPGDRRYAMIELLLNAPVFITEVLYNTSDENFPIWRTYLMVEPNDLVKLVDSDLVDEIRITLLIPGNVSEEGEYSASPVHEILEGTNSKGEKSRVFILANGVEHHETWSESEETLLNVHRLYSRS